MQRNANIKDFFKPYTKPKSRGPSPDKAHDARGFPPKSMLLPSPFRDIPGDESTCLGRNSSTPVPAAARLHEADCARDSVPSAMTANIGQDATSPPTHSGKASFSSLQAPPSASPPAGASSSFPSLSQSSTTSKRCVQNGIQVVRTSDSEEDLSDDSMPDVSAIMSQFQRKKTVSPEVRRTRSLRSGRGKLSTRPMPSSDALKSLLARREKDLATDAKVAAAKAELAELEEAGNDSAGEPVTNEMLKAVSTNPDKLFLALEKTEALDTRTVWSFFEKSQKRSGQPFPKKKIKGALAIMNKPPRVREAAVLSGLVKGMVPKARLPDQILSWMLDEICLGTREDVAGAYVDILERCPAQVEALLTRERIDTLFTQLGTKKDVFDLTAEPTAVQVLRLGASRRKPPPIRWLLELLRRVAPSLSGEAREHALSLIIRIAPDDGIRENAMLQLLIPETIDALMSSIREDSAASTLLRVSSQLYSWARHPILQAGIFHYIPAYTPRECTFRRQLALAFFLDSVKPLSLSLTSPNLLPSVLHRLETSRDYVFTAGTDFTCVSALFNILDIAIDAGFSDRAFALVTKASGASREEVQVARQEEDEFNEEVDVLVSAVRSVTSQIRGSGIESLPKTEAKSVMERLVHRVESAVRTRERTGGRFDGGRDGVGSAAVMSSWIGQPNGVH